MQIRLSASQIAAADDCRRKHWYQSIAKVRTAGYPANLAFGHCVDVSVREYLLALTKGAELPDPVERFREAWALRCDEDELVYAATQTPEQFERMGQDLMQQFPDAWDKTGFEVALDHRDEPLLDLRLKARLGSESGVELVLDGVIDVVAYTQAAELAVVDIKTSQAPHTRLYTHRADQLTSYQLLLEAHRQRLGLPKVERLGFLDLLKRVKSSRIEPPILVPVRSDAELLEFRQKVFWLADDIRRQRFPRVSRMQYNAPCELCDFAAHCVHGETDGLIFPDQPTVASA